MEFLGTSHIRTTAYHPQANGIIERFHRQLKVALKTHSDPAQWYDALPLVLLGIRTALKSDIGCSVAELVYGTTLRIPGEFFIANPNPSIDPAQFVGKLKSLMCQLKATPAAHHHSTPLLVILTSTRISAPVLMFLLGTMLFVSHYRFRTMVHIEL